MDFITLIYLADISKAFMVSMVILAFLCAVFAAILLTCAMDETVKLGYKPVIVSGSLCVVLVMAATLYPSKEGIYTMAAAKGVEMAAANPDVKRLAGKSLDVLEGAMDKYIKESKGKGD